jgi:hypothetical protein
MPSNIGAKTAFARGHLDARRFKYPNVPCERIASAKSPCPALVRESDNELRAFRDRRGSAARGLASLDCHVLRRRYSAMFWTLCSGLLMRCKPPGQSSCPGKRNNRETGCSRIFGQASVGREKGASSGPILAPSKSEFCGSRYSNDR